MINWILSGPQGMCGSRMGDRGSGLPPPLKNRKNKVVFSNTGPDPLTYHKAAYLCSMR